MQELVLIVRSSQEGWWVEDGATYGPFISKSRALDLAEGMAHAVRASGQPARVYIADE